MKKWKGKLKQFLEYTIVPLLLSILASPFVGFKTGITIFLFFELLISFFIWKEKIGYETLIAFFFALFITSHFLYEYTTPSIFIGSVNLFPLIVWTAGLVALREIYEKTKIKGRLIILFLTYWTALGALEVIGFYLLKIRIAENFPSLLGIGILHAPINVKVFYILAGPIYLIITDYLKVE